MARFTTFGKALLFIYCMALLPTSAFSSDNSKKEQAAIAAAGQWLALVDQGSYTTSFNETAASFKSGFTLEQWEQRLGTDREPEGAVISRKVKRSALRVGPLGRDNVEIWYTTSFRNLKSAIERVYIRLVDGQWRVTGYIITADELELIDIIIALLLTAVIIAAWVIEVKSGQRLVTEARGFLPEQERPRK